MTKRTHSDAFTTSNDSLILYTGKGSTVRSIIHTTRQFITIMHKTFPKTKNKTLEEMMVFSGAEFIQD